MNVLVFDLETVPDVEAGRRIYGLEGLPDAEVVQAMTHVRYTDTDTRSDFLRLHLHRIVAISAVLRSGDKLTVWSLGEPESPEAELIQRFFHGLESLTPTLVSWNGSGFDLPVLHYRALRHGVTARRYWETGDSDPQFRYSNYLGRFHWRHIDLMDVLAGYQARAAAPLHEAAQLLGLPGKYGMEGSGVLERWQRGEISAIRDYCESDVLNTYLIYLRFELMRGRLSAEAHAAECQRLREYLREEARPHWLAYLEAWDAAAA